MLQLVLGRAGAGKTETCIRQIGQALAGEPQGEYVLLTPEQATFANEKRLLASIGNAGGLQVRVLSFRRFVHWVLQETGGGLLPVLDNVGKSLLVRQILEEEGQNLPAFQRVWDKQGFVAQLVGLMEELRTYQIVPEVLTDCLASGVSGPPDEPLLGLPLPEGLADKLGDIRRIYERYEQALAGGWLDLAGELSLLCQKLPVWPRLSQAEFWLDGFHGFTPAEFQVIAALLQAGRRVVVTLNLPAGLEKKALPEEGLFYPPWETAQVLRQLARQNRQPMGQPLYLPLPQAMRFAASPELGALEAALAEEEQEMARLPAQGLAQEARLQTGQELRSRQGLKEAGVSKPADRQAIAGTQPLRRAGLHLAACAGYRQEVERMAIEVAEAVREDGLRYRELVVLLRQPEMYESLLQQVLPAYGIPYFFDGPKTLDHHPLISLMKELMVILTDRWGTETLMACQKTGLPGLSVNQGDKLENYCLAYGIQRMHWESPRSWRFSAPGEEGGAKIDGQMEIWRLKLWQPIQALRRQVQAAQSWAALVAAVYDYLCEINAEAYCSRQANLALALGRPEEAQFHQRTWQQLMALFDQTVVFLAAAPPDPALLAAVWESGLAALEMQALPPALDQVTVCSMDRSRAPLARRAWILGVNEGLVPADIQEDSLLTAPERQWLAGQAVQLAPDSRRRIFSENYLIYVALTRASEALYLSYARSDGQGGALAPSPLLARLCRWFPALQMAEEEPSLLRRLVRPGQSLPLLGLALQEAKGDRRPGAGQGRAPGGQPETTSSQGQLGDVFQAESGVAGIWRALYDWYARRPSYRRSLAQLEKGYALAPLGRPLPGDLARQLFGQVIKTSITRLEQFQACPFAHYLAYGLKLAPRQEYEIRPPEIGNFFHDSLEALISGIKAEGLTLGALTDAELAARAEGVAAAQLERKHHEIFLTSAWYRSLSLNLRRILQRAAQSLAYQERQGAFYPYALEAAFGFEEPGSWPPIALELGHDRQILLRGRIDRIDAGLLPESGDPYLRVVDYKSGQKDLALWEVYYGLKLQLVLYLEAALAAVPGAQPAGLFYYQVHDPLLSADNRRLLEDEPLRQKALLQGQKLRGYVLNDQAVARLMDREVEQSLFLPVALTKTGEFTKQSRVLTRQEFQALGRHSRVLLAQAGQRLMEGEVSLSPYHTGKQQNACTYCPYGAVCRFDPAVPGHQFRYLPSVKDEQVLYKMAGGWPRPAAQEEGGIDHESLE